MVQLADIALAQYRLARYLQPTPLEAAPGLGSGIWLKLENVNKTHSFKIRGAINAMLALDAAARSKGVVAASSGNHAQALAYASHLLGVRAKILMPEHTPRRKVSGVKRYGAEAVLYGRTYDETELEGRRLEREENLTYVSPYNDFDVVAGAGTVGLEIIEALPEVARVVVPASGSGLIAGVAVAVKALRPSVEVVAVNAETSPALYNLFYNAHLPHVNETLAEALSGDIEQGSITIPLAQQYVDRVVLVSEAEIARAMRWMVDEQGWIVEGGAATGVAALLNGAVDDSDQPTVVVITGGNVDTETLRRVLR